ncbi:MAG: LysR substrate-binding domain-containing protein [Endozoicomonas sp.]|uniref:LysR family transcriptional regulator n=1 Tax=Endozoicomonas sp. TaxID=1892382 RepID=UPI003D9B3DBA
MAIFVCVVDSASFAGAARKMSTSRSRVSEQVSQLEEALGVRLIHRTTRQLSLTEEGRRVYQQVKGLPDILECVSDIVSTREPVGRVSLSLSTDVAQTYVLPILDAFRTRYPGVHLDLVINDETSDLVAHDIDLAIRTSFQDSSSMVARVLYQERTGVYASPKYIGAFGLPRTIKELESLQWLTLSQASKDGSQQLFARGKNVIVKPLDYYSCNSPWMIQRMLLSGLGLGCILPSAVQQDIEEGRLVAVMPELSGESLTVSLVYPSRKKIPRRTRCVIDFLLDADLFHQTAV